MTGGALLLPASGNTPETLKVLMHGGVDEVEFSSVNQYTSVVSRTNAAVDPSGVHWAQQTIFSYADSATAETGENPRAYNAFTLGYTGANATATVAITTAANGTRTLTLTDSGAHTFTLGTGAWNTDLAICFGN